MSVLSKLTIIIPTYNRHRYVLRNMKYWSDSEVTVHILDGSEKPISIDKLSELGSNIHYHHLPISILDRLGLAENYVKTKYAALLGDDEFSLPTGLLKCIEELEFDETLISCMGRCLDFDFSSNNITGSIQYSEMVNYSILQDNPINRMISHMNPYTCSTIYSVIRAEAWKCATKLLSKRTFPDPSVSEIQFELSICYFGKSKVIPVLMWLRSNENPPFDKRNEAPFYKWWNMKNSEQDRKDLLIIMAETLSEKKPTEYHSIIEGVEKAFDAFVLWGRNRMRQQKNIKYYIFIIAGHLPVFLRKFIRPLMKAFLPVNNQSIIVNKTLIEAAKELEGSGVLVDFDQLSQINELVLNFHAEESK